MSKSKNNLGRVVFLVVIILAVLGGLAYLIKNKTNNAKTKQANTSTPVNSSNLFDKQGTSTQTYTPVTQTKTATQLEAAAQAQSSTAADFNSLAMSYHKSGNQDKALQTINDGLAKFPNDQSLLLTKDLIENPNF